MYGHWHWLFSTILSQFQDIFRYFDDAFALDGGSMMLLKKNKKLPDIPHLAKYEVVIIARTSPSCYRMVWYRGESVMYKTFNRADRVAYFIDKTIKGRLI